jgi:hypothetical protein
MKGEPMKIYVLLFGLILFGCSQDESIIASKANGEVIVRALEAYKNDHGIYPLSLNDLTPQYLREIPAPSYGKKEWDYICVSKDNSYRLFVWGKWIISDGYMYNDDTHGWETIHNQ